MKAPIFAALLAVAVSGCGSGGTTAAVQPAAPPAAVTSVSGAASEVDATITVPAALGTSSRQRAAQYVSASTLGLKVTVTDVPPTGAAVSFAATTTTFTLGVGLNRIVIPTPASTTGHSETLTYVAYNTAPVGNVIPAAAKAVGYGITSAFVVQPGQNVNNVVLSGVADTFLAPLAQTGAFGMMSSLPPALLGLQASLGFGGNAVPTGIATVLDAGGNTITTSAGAPWPLVGSVPPLATTVGTGVPVAIAETAGTCGAVGGTPHLKLAYNGGTPSTSAALSATSDAIQAVYDGAGGAGWFATVTARAQSASLTYTLSSLAATSTSADYSCANQTLSFSQLNETALITIIEHNSATPYTITVPNVSSCTNLVNVYSGNSTAPGNLIAPGTPTSLGLNTNFTVQLIPVPPAAAQCNIQIQDANVAATGGATFPGATTYVAALLPATTYQIIVP